MLMKQTGIERVCIKETYSAPSEPTPLSSLGSKQEAPYPSFLSLSLPSAPPLPTSSLWQTCKLCPLTETTAPAGLLLPPRLLPPCSACSPLPSLSVFNQFFLKGIVLT